ASWCCKTTLYESTVDGPSVALDTSSNVLLLSWTGTDNNGCLFSCGSINTIRYDQFFVGGGGGSVAYGSLIKMADGTEEPVQNVQVGSQVIVYNVPTAYTTVATVTQIIVVTVNSQLIIHTSARLPFRADVN